MHRSKPADFAVFDCIFIHVAPSSFQHQRSKKSLWNLSGEQDAYRVYNRNDIQRHNLTATSPAANSDWLAFCIPMSIILVMWYCRDAKHTDCVWLVPLALSWDSTASFGKTDSGTGALPFRDDNANFFDTNIIMWKNAFHCLWARTATCCTTKWWWPDRRALPLIGGFVKGYHQQCYSDCIR